jgi:hypothetical protein
MNKCSYCIHNGVCKHQENYREVISNIVLEVPEPFSLVLNCKHYDAKSCTLNDYINNCSSNSTLNSAYNLTKENMNYD